MTLAGEDQGSGKPYDSPFFHLDLSHVKPRCEVCKTARGQLICTNCRVGCYCSHECRKEGWVWHKMFCSRAKKGWKVYEEQEKELNAALGNSQGPQTNFCADANFITNGYWGLFEIKRFNDSLIAILRICSNYRTIPGIKHAVLLALRYLYLNRPDGRRMRVLASEFLLQLGQDQLAYDFLKFWGIQRDLYDYSNLFKPYLHYWKEDLSEDFDWNTNKLFLQHEVALLLIKLRYYQNCCVRESFQRGFLVPVFKSNSLLSRFDGNGLVLDHIYRYLIAPGVFASRQFTQSAVIKNQIDTKISYVEKENRIMIRALVNPNPLLSIKSPDSYEVGSAEEAYFTLLDALPAWRQTKFALEYLREYCLKTYGDTNYPIELKPKPQMVGFGVFVAVPIHSLNANF